jgi:hypothetical protein
VYDPTAGMPLLRTAILESQLSGKDQQHMPWRVLHGASTAQTPV